MESNLETNEVLANEEENILGTDRISKLFIKFVVPSVIAMVITGMQTVVDGIFVGNFVGSNAMASISVASPFLQMIFGVSMLMSIGGLSYMGRSLGEGKIKLAQDIFKTTTIVLGVVAFALGFVGFFFSSQIASVLGANEALISGVAMYIKVISIFAAPMGIAFLFGFSGRLIERPNLYFIGTIVSLATNIILNYVLIVKLNFGIAGAAVATGLSYSVILVVVIGPILKKETILNIFSGKFNKKTIWPVIYNGSSEAVASVAAATSAFLFNMAFIRIIGEAGVAAFTSINYVSQFGTFIVFGIADGIASIVSYNYGARKLDRVKKTISFSTKVTIGIGVITFGTIFFFGESLVSIFVASEKEVLKIAVEGSKIYAFAFLLNGVNILCSSYFTSIGYAKESIIIAGARGLVFITLGISILPRILGINGVWMTIPIAEVMTLIVCFVLVKRYLKKSGDFVKVKKK
ncbi:MAG: MATE family efflux transporter [Sarcina sp.]